MDGKLKFTSKVNQGSTFVFKVEVSNWKNDMTPVQPQMKKILSGSLEEFSAIDPFKRSTMSLDLKQ